VIYIDKLSGEIGINVLTILTNAEFRPIFYDKAYGLLYANGESLERVNNVVLWFLPCLFITESMFYYIKRVAKNNARELMLILFLISLLAFAESVITHDELPWSVDVALTGVVFFGSGFVVKEKLEQRLIRAGNNRKVLLAACMVVAGMSVMISQWNGRVDMNSNHYGNYFLFYAAAFSGIASWVLAALLVNKCNVLSYFGKNTMIILGLHVQAGLLAFQVFTAVANRLTTSAVVVNDELLLFIVTSLTLIMLVPFIYLINRFIPLAAGKTRRTKGSPAQI